MIRLLVVLLLIFKVTDVFSSQCSITHAGGSCVDYRYSNCLTGQYYEFNGCATNEMCCYPNRAAMNVPPIAPDQCGLSTPVTTSTKIVGGNATRAGEFPWQVSLRYMGQHMCGGILIDKNWVLTAAHCFEGNHHPQTWSVVIGENDRAFIEGFERIINVDTLFVHSKFDPQLYINDIAMMKLVEDVTVSAYVRPVCLPAATDTYDYETCVITGWGAAYSGGHGTHAMYKASIPVLPRSVCSYLLNRNLPDTMICAGFKQGGVDTCQGDSGGPLVCLKNGVYQVAGIVSWGYSCAEQYTPGVYSNVPKFKGWIETVLNAYDPSSPLLPHAIFGRRATDKDFIKYT